MKSSLWPTFYKRQKRPGREAVAHKKGRGERLLRTKRAGARGCCAQKGPGREVVVHKKGRGERLLRTKRAGARGCCAQKGPGREAVALKKGRGEKLLRTKWSSLRNLFVLAHLYFSKLRKIQCVWVCVGGRGAKYKKTEYPRKRRKMRKKLGK